MLHEVLAELLHLARTPHLHQVASGALREQEVELVEIDETVVPVPLNLVCKNARYDLLKFSLKYKNYTKQHAAGLIASAAELWIVEGVFFRDIHSDLDKRLLGVFLIFGKWPLKF